MQVTPVSRHYDGAGGYLDELGTPYYTWASIAPQIRSSESMVREYPYRGAFVGQVKVGDRVRYEGQNLVVAEVAPGPDGIWVAWLSWEYME